jgi:hypothetical protein
VEIFEVGIERTFVDKAFEFTLATSGEGRLLFEAFPRRNLSAFPLRDHVGRVSVAGECPEQQVAHVFAGNRAIKVTQDGDLIRRVHRGIAGLSVYFSAEAFLMLF